MSVAAPLAAAWDVGNTDIDVIATFDASVNDGTTGTAYVTVLYIQNKNNTI
jgi:hypothetical protein